MSKVLIEKSGCRVLRGRKTCSNRKGFLANKKNGKVSGKIKIGLIVTFTVILAVGLLGVFYLYQVNSIATKGFEIRKVENNLLKLRKESQKLRIKEMELRSMKNIEKSVENLDLVSSSEIIYMELSGPIAMK